jgi:photosystem II stability/assembly factor-like uncharacterized protein
MRNFYKAVITAIIVSGALSTGVQAQSVWTLRNPLTQVNNLNSIVWAGTQYVAVGVAGTIVTSPDGVTWTVRQSNTSVTLYGVAWTGSQLVAVGQAGTILTSSNGGTSWNSQSSGGVTGALYSVAYSGSLLVAVGQAGVLVTSPNGTTWTVVNHGQTTQGLHAVIWSSTMSRFVVVGASSAGLTSTDGATWSSVNTGGGTMNAVVQVASEFLAVGASGVVRGSTDGTTWFSRGTAGTSAELKAVVSGSRLVAVGAGGIIRHSTDALSWSTSSSGTTQALNSVATSGSGYVAVGVAGTVLNSTDGQTWVQTSSVLTSMHALTSRVVTSPATDTQLYAVGAAGTILASSNGTTWTKRTSGVSVSLNSITAAGPSGAVLAAVGSNSTILTSTDGSTWVPRTSPLGGTEMYSVAGSNATTPVMVATGAATTVIVSTNGGSSWTFPTGGTNGAIPFYTIYSIAWQTSGTFVGVGENGRAWRTTNVATGAWTEIVTPVTVRLNAIVFTGAPLNLFVAVGDGGKIITSTNGTTWLESTSGVTTTLRSLTWTGSLLVVTGDGGRVLTSPDGVTWTVQVSGTTTSLYGSRWDGRQVVAVGANGLILTSDPAALPLPPTHSAPAAGAVRIPVNPIFSWTPASGASTYSLQVSATSFADTLVDTITAGNATSFLTGPFTPGATYFWRARTNGGTGSSAWSSPTSFTIRTIDSAAPFPSSPANHAVNIPLSTSLSWSAYPGAVSYRVQVAADSFFTLPLVNDSIPNSTRIFNASTNSTLYFWRVNARLSSGVTAWSPVQRFTTTAPSPPVPVLNTPAHNAIAVSFPNTTVTWNASSGAITYRLQVSTVSNFATTLRDTVVTGATSALVTNLTVNGVYYWRVSAENGAGSSAFSSARTFTTAVDAPPPPSLVSPAQGAIDVSVFTSFSWNASSGAVSYHLQLAHLSNFSLIVFEDSNLTTLTRNAGQLANTSDYFWRVRAKNPAGVSAWSERNFRTGTAPTVPPPAPVPLTPAQFAQNVSQSPTLQWNAAATAMSYRVQVSTSPTFATLLVNDSLINGTSRAIANLSGSTSYYWRVAGTNNIGTGAWSEVFNFNTLNTVPATPVLIAPEAFATGVAISPTLSWNASGGATSYRVQVSTVSSFATLLVNDSITATTRAIGPLGGNTDYFWRVNARNTAGVSAYSTTQRFTTGAVPMPAVPVLVLPAQFKDSVAVAGVTLVWDPASGASSYRVQVSTSPTFATVARDDSGLTTTSRFVGPLLPSTEYYWRVSSKNSVGVSAFSGARRFTTEQGTSLLPGGILMRSMSFGAGRSLRFGLPTAQRVTVRIFDMQGNLVADLLDEPRAAGYHTLALPHSLRGGLYLVDFRAGSTRLTLKTQP